MPQSFANSLTLALLCSSLFLSSHALADETSAGGAAYIQVGKAKTRKTVLDFPGVKTLAGRADPAGLASSITKVIKNDLAFMDLFSFFEGAVTESNKPDITISTEIQWMEVELTLTLILTDVPQKKEIFRKTYIARTSETKILGHNVANDIVNRLTGFPGIFLTKIVAVCDKGGKKELYLMNIDGTEAKQITHHRSIIVGPAWSPDGTRIAYSLYSWQRPKGTRERIKNLDLYEIDLRSKEIFLLSNRQGMNSGAAYAPDGQNIALTMSFLGNPEIFLFNRSTKTVRQMTHSLGFDVDPSFSPDGESLAFVSSRSGKPMVFKMNLSNEKIERLTFAGDYNATPNWSPKGDKLVFAGWIEGRFDIFTMNPDSTKIERLTKNQGSNEDPVFSPDGNFIAFSSNRAGARNIYVMNIDGTYVKRLTYGFGNCTTPKWSGPNAKLNQQF